VYIPVANTITHNQIPNLYRLDMGSIASGLIPFPNCLRSGDFWGINNSIMVSLFFYMLHIFNDMIKLSISILTFSLSTWFLFKHMVSTGF